jgi:hypothetical protein
LIRLKKSIKIMNNNYEILCEVRSLSQGDEQTKKAKRAALKNNPAKIQQMFKACGVKTMRHLLEHADRYAENTGY